MVVYLLASFCLLFPLLEATEVWRACSRDPQLNTCTWNITKTASKRNLKGPHKGLQQFWSGHMTGEADIILSFDTRACPSS